MMHGAIYAVMKTEGGPPAEAPRLDQQHHHLLHHLLRVTTMATLLYVPHMAARMRAHPWLFSVALVNMLAIANIPREIHLAARRAPSSPPASP
jgi:cytochrome d ubiquinol oxidase subunit II